MADKLHQQVCKAATSVYDAEYQMRSHVVQRAHDLVWARQSAPYVDLPTATDPKDASDENTFESMWPAYYRTAVTECKRLGDLQTLDAWIERAKIDDKYWGNADDSDAFYTDLIWQRCLLLESQGKDAEVVEQVQGLLQDPPEDREWLVQQWRSRLLPLLLSEKRFDEATQLAEQMDDGDESLSNTLVVKLWQGDAAQPMKVIQNARKQDVQTWLQGLTVQACIQEQIDKPWAKSLLSNQLMQFPYVRGEKGELLFSSKTKGTSLKELVEPLGKQAVDVQEIRVDPAEQTEALLIAFADGQKIVVSLKNMTLRHR